MLTDDVNFDLVAPLEIECKGFKSLMDGVVLSVPERIISAQKPAWARATAPIVLETV